MKIHPEALKAFAPYVEKFVLSLELGNRPTWMFSDEQHQKLFSFLEKHLGEYAHSWTLASCLEELAQRYIRQNVDIVPKGTFGEKLPIALVKAAVNCCLDFLGSLPRSYRVFFPLTNFTTGYRGTLKLSDRVGITEFSGDYAPSIHERTLDLLAVTQGDLAHHFSSQYPHLYVQVDGLIDGDEGHGSLAEAISVAKSFLYLMRTTSHWVGTPGGMEAPLTCFYIDQHMGPAHAAPFFLPATIRSGLYEFDLWPWHCDDANKGIQFDELEDDLLVSLARFARTAEGLPDHPHIVSAAEWAFDSHYESNETRSFIFQSIALESLLGAPGGEAGLSSVLADRLAYLVGSSVADRHEIQESFRRYYRIRSQLVHGTTSRISAGDRELLNWGGEILRRAVQRELELAAEPSD
jgi:hypothetical protein